MRRRGVLIISLALVLGLVAAGGVWYYMQYLQKQTQEAIKAAEESQTKVETVSVVVAKRDIPPRVAIAGDMVETKQISKEALHPQAISDSKEAIGKITKVPITAGEQILASKFTAGRAESGLTFIIPPNKRAVSVGVSEVISSGGNILPGDLVDIIGIFDAKTMGKDMAAYILQGVEVLAVAQTKPGESINETEEPAVARVERTASTQLGQTPRPTPVPQDEPEEQPGAKSVTLAVTPEEAQRLVLAETKGKLRLVLRPFNDPTLTNLPEATLGTIRSPVQPDAAIITAVDISPTNAKAGDTLKVQITVQNTSAATISTQGPDPEFTYVQGQTFYSQNFPSQDGKYRVAIGFDGVASAPLPYRWGLGADLPAGSSTTVTGYIKLTHDIRATNFWAALVREPSTVLQNNVGMTTVTVVPADVAIIAVDLANVRSGPTIDASVIAQVQYGTELPILGQEKDWYKIKLPDGREGYVAAGWIVGAGTGG